MTDASLDAPTDIETRGNGAPAVVRSETRTYGVGSDNSYFQDKALVTLNGAESEAARERLNSYAGELDRIMRDDNPSDRNEAQRARQIAYVVRNQSGDVETRAGATSSTIAGFTTPEYLIEDYAIYRTPSMSFTDQTTKLPLTPYGLQINVPSFTSPSTNGQQTAENQGVVVTSPAGLNIPVNLVTVAAQVPISQQLFDRGGLSGLAFDKIILAQILQNQDAAVDAYVINQATANAYTTTWSSSATIANFLGDLGLARAGLADTAGTRMVATHLFTTTDQFSYWSSQTDSTSGVPFIQPDSSAIVLAEQTGDPKWHSWTGVHIAGSLLWHTDDNIPASGANTQLLVCRPKEIYTFDGQNLAFAYEETAAQNLTVQVGMRTYVGAVARFPKAVASITGTAYPTSNI